MNYAKPILFFLLLVFSLSTHGQDNADETKDLDNSYQRNVEKNITFNRNIKSNKLEYQLEPISDGRFKLIFANPPTEYVQIKIYDIIGNLILSEDNKHSLKPEIEFNFHEKNNKIYVVRVEAGEDHLTKKVHF